MSSHWCLFGGGHEKGGPAGKPHRVTERTGSSGFSFLLAFLGEAGWRRRPPPNLCSPAGLLAAHLSAGSGDKERQAGQCGAVLGSAAGGLRVDFLLCAGMGRLSQLTSSRLGWRWWSSFSHQDRRTASPQHLCRAPGRAHHWGGMP